MALWLVERNVEKKINASKVMGKWVEKIPVGIELLFRDKQSLMDSGFSRLLRNLWFSMMDCQMLE